MTSSDLIIDDISHSYSHHKGNMIHTLKDLNLRICKSTITGIVGPSGCGKSTLLKIIGEIIKPSKGSVRFSDGSSLKNKCSFVFQDFALFPWRNVYKNVAFPLEIQKINEKKQTIIIHKYLKLVGLTKFKDRFIYQLSGGMKQRVAIARALAQRVPILLMDEPFSSLDELTRRRMQDELLRIQSSEKKTILFVTHSIDEAIYLSDVVVLLSSGPGRIKKELNVRLGIKRYKKNVRVKKEFTRLRQCAWSELKNERF